MGDTLDVAEVTRLVDRSHRAVREWIRRGKFPRAIPAARNAHARWDKAEVEAWLKKGDVPAPEAEVAATKLVESADTLSIEFESDKEIVTLEDAVAHAKVDLATFYVDRWECTSWQVGMKLREFAEKGRVVGETPVKKSLWRVRLFLRRIRPKPLHDAMMAIFERMGAHAPKYKAPARRPRGTDPHLLEIDLFDVHFGKLAWAPETGQDYDLKIAESVFRNAVDDLLAKASGYEIDQILIPVGNDFFHVDNLANTTTAGTPMDVDGRYFKIYTTGFMAMVWAVERALETAPVKVYWIPGNHDGTNSYHLAHTLAVWFRHHPDVSVDHGPKRRKYHRYGDCLIGMTHGNEEPTRSLPGLMANEERVAWGETTCHEWRKGHVHKSKVELTVPVDTHDGVTIRTLRSLSATDAYHFRKGYGGPRSAEGYLMSRTEGYAGHFVVNARTQ